MLSLKTSYNGGNNSDDHENIQNSSWLYNLELPHHLNQNLDESLADLPAEDAGVLLLVLVYLVFNLGGDFSKIFYIYSKNGIMEYY